MSNAAEYLLSPHMAHRPGKTAFVDDREACNFAELDSRSARFAAYLARIDVRREERILLLLEDGISFVVACLGAIRAGVVPVMANPLLPAADLAFLLEDSRARLVVASPSTWARLCVAMEGQSFLRHVLFDGAGAPADTLSFAEALASPGVSGFAATHEDEPCMWQYSSGSTGRPKGTIHSHGAVIRLAACYPAEILGLAENDTTFSAAKMFFGYGFGNSLIFPLSVGATAILMAERATPAAVGERFRRHLPTIFYGVPTLYRSLLDNGESIGADALARLRACVSAGEALPSQIGESWRGRYGLEILDGIGSTEMLHIYISNRAGAIRPGTTGRPLAGYEVKLLGEDGRPVADGEIGELHVAGPTSASGYWCRRTKMAETFLGRWVATGDKFVRSADGRYAYRGRSDDMIKVSGIYVSPVEVEEALAMHPSVVEAAVVGAPDEAGLVKCLAYVVTEPGATPDERLAEELKQHVKGVLAPHKYPRTIRFVTELPKTASGKIERYRLRGQPFQSAKP